MEKHFSATRMNTRLFRQTFPIDWTFAARFLVNVEILPSFKKITAPITLARILDTNWSLATSLTVLPKRFPISKLPTANRTKPMVWSGFYLTFSAATTTMQKFPRLLVYTCCHQGGEAVLSGEHLQTDLRAIITPSCFSSTFHRSKRGAGRNRGIGQFARRGERNRWRIGVGRSVTHCKGYGNGVEKVHTTDCKDGDNNSFK